MICADLIWDDLCWFVLICDDLCWSVMRHLGCRSELAQIRVWWAGRNVHSRVRESTLWPRRSDRAHRPTEKHHRPLSNNTVKHNKSNEDRSARRVVQRQRLTCPAQLTKYSHSMAPRSVSTAVTWPFFTSTWLTLVCSYICTPDTWNTAWAGDEPQQHWSMYAVSRTVSRGGHSERSSDLRRGHHAVAGQMQRSHQVMHVHQRVQPRHVSGLDDVTADAQNPADTQSSLGAAADTQSSLGAAAGTQSSLGAAAGTQSSLGAAAGTQSSLGAAADTQSSFGTQQQKAFLHCRRN